MLINTNIVTYIAVHGIPIKKGHATKELVFAKL